MKPARHPAHVLLTAYATGTLSLAAGLVVSAHLDACADCRADVLDLEEQEGEALDEAPPAGLSPQRLDAILRRLDEAPAEPMATPQPARLRDVELPLAAAAIGFGKPRVIAPGYWVAHCKGQPIGGWRSYLLRAPAGARLPAHAPTN